MQGSLSHQWESGRPVHLERSRAALVWTNGRMRFGRGGSGELQRGSELWQGSVSDLGLRDAKGDTFGKLKDSHEILQSSGT